MSGQPQKPKPGYPNPLFNQWEIIGFVNRCIAIKNYSDTPVEVMEYVLDIELACRKLEVFLMNKKLKELKDKVSKEKASILDIEKPNDEDKR